MDDILVHFMEHPDEPVNGEHVNDVIDEAVNEDPVNLYLNESMNVLVVWLKKGVNDVGATDELYVVLR